MIISVLILNFFTMGFYPWPQSAPTGIIIVPCVRPSFRLSVRSSVRPECQYLFTNFSYHPEFWLDFAKFHEENLYLKLFYMLIHFLRIPRNMQLFYDRPVSGLSDDVTLPLILFKDFSYWPEIWWEDAQYHEAPRYLNGYARVMFACQPNFEIFSWLAWARKVSHFRKCVRKSHYCLKFGGIIQCTMKQITVSNLWCSRPRVLSCCERRVPFEKSFDCE